MTNSNVATMTMNPLEFMEAKWLSMNPRMGKDDFYKDAELYNINKKRAQCIYNFVSPLIKEGKELTTDCVEIDNSAETLIDCIVPVFQECVYSGSDQCTCRNLSTGQRMNIKKRHPMADYSEILYYREVSSNDTFIVTTAGVSYNHYNSLTEIEWRKIRLIDYDGKDNRLYFYTLENEEPVFGMSSYDILKWKSEDTLFTNILNAIAECFNDNSNEKFNKALELYYSEQYDEALQIIDELIQEESTNLGVYHYIKADILKDKLEKGDDIQQVDSQFELAKECLEKDNEYSLHSQLYSSWAELKEMSGDLLAARDNYLLCLGKADKDEKKQFRKEYAEFLENHRDFWENFTRNVEYSQRKLIMPVKDVSGCVREGIAVFEKEEIPNNISFPVGHPVPNELYIGHPYNPSIYVPYNEHEEIFLKDKIDELCRVLQCLGAEEISITSVSGLTLEEINEQSLSTKGNADIKAASANVQQDLSKTSSNKLSSGRKISQKQKFNPTRKPYIPEDNLIWYPHEVQWQRLASQRIDGNILEHHLQLSTKDTSFVANNEKKQIEASVKYLWAKGNVDNEDVKNMSIDESKETVLTVEVVFKPIEELTDNDSSIMEKAIPSNPLTQIEDVYKEEVLFYLNDGEIGDLERKSLNRRRIKLGISEERANEIELMCHPAPSFSYEEVEYIEICKEICGDGEISPRVRKILSREAENLGISYERAIELEKYIK